MSCVKYLKKLTVLLFLIITGCAWGIESRPSAWNSYGRSTERTRYSTTAMPPPPVFVAPSDVAGRPGYFEIKTSVINQADSPILSLKQTDFIAESAGTRLPIVFFRENPRLPISLGILVDTSGSMEPKLATVQIELAKFINDLPSQDEIFLIAFNANPYLLQALTTDHQAVVQTLTKFRAKGQTSLYDSIVSGVGVLGKGRYPSKAILLITDGMDNTSTAKEADAVAWLKSNDVRFYAIGIGDPNAGNEMAADRLDANVLQHLANAAGGAVFLVTPISQDGGKGFTIAIKRISGMVNYGYTIGVTVPPGAPVFPLNLTVRNHPDVVVTTHVINPPLP